MDIDIDKLIHEYRKEQAMKEVARYLMSREDNTLDRTEKRLSIIEHKRRLGLPVSDDDYEEATNEGKSFFSRIAPSAGKEGLQAIPRPGFMTGKSNGAIFKFAESPRATIPSMLFGTPLGAAKHGKPTGIGKFFGLF
jgi:hypothetical protein